MNICMFTNTYLPHVGGVARSVAVFSEDLCSMGHRVLVIAPSFQGQSDLEGPGYQVARVPAIQNFNGSDFSVRIRLPFVIDKRIREFKPDIIHSHHPYLLGDAAVRTARQRSLPLVFTHHTLYENYTHYVPLNSKAMKRFVINLSTQYANLCSCVVAPSRSVALLIEERGVKRPAVVIPTGVDLDFFAGGRRQKFRAAYGIGDEELVVGHLGRLAPEKNLAYLAEAVALFLEGEPQGRFLVAGQGPSEREIRHIFEERGLGERLIMAGVVTGRELADMYQAMDVFVFASKTETQGLVLAEAMAAGKPVVAQDASGTREVVRDGGNGRLLAEDASTGDFCRAIYQVSRQEAAEHWRREGLKTARQFSRQACARRLAALYERVSNEQIVKSQEDADEFVSWESLLRALKAEWELLSEKAQAAVGALEEGEQTDTKID